MPHSSDIPVSNKICSQLLGQSSRGGGAVCCTGLAPRLLKVADFPPLYNKHTPTLSISSKADNVSSPTVPDIPQIKPEGNFYASIFQGVQTISVLNGKKIIKPENFRVEGHGKHTAFHDKVGTCMYLVSCCSTASAKVGFSP